MSSFSSMIASASSALRSHHLYRLHRYKFSAPVSAHGDTNIIHHQPAGLVFEYPVARAIACIRLWPRIGLSIYIVDSMGHQSRSATYHALSPASAVVHILEAGFQPFFSPFVVDSGCSIALSDAVPVITILICPFQDRHRATPDATQ